MQCGAAMLRASTKRGIHVRTRPEGLAGPYGEKCSGGRLTRTWPSRGRTKPAHTNGELRHPTRAPLATKLGQEPGRSANAGTTLLTPPPLLHTNHRPRPRLRLGSPYKRLHCTNLTWWRRRRSPTPFKFKWQLPFPLYPPQYQYSNYLYLYNHYPYSKHPVASQQLGTGATK